MKTVDAALIARLAREHGTPFYLYDADVIRARIADLRPFDVIRFAQKACSNRHILELMRAEGVLVDAVSAGEIERALRAGYDAVGNPAGLVYTADLIDDATLETAVSHDIPVNAGAVDMLDQVGRRKPGHRVWLRVNPGFGHGHSRKTSTGGEWSKHGIWYEHLGAAFEIIANYELDLVGLHTHIGSGSDFEHLGQVCDAMVRQVRSSDVDVQSISGGGGLPIPYLPKEELFDSSALYEVWDKARREIESILGHAVRLEIEPGRFLVGEAGVLVAKVWSTKHQANNFFCTVDAGFDNLVRPAMYGSHHEISVVRSDGKLAATDDLQPTVVSGPLCESGDVFTQTEGGVVSPRDLPPIAVGDLIVLHDAGAYSSSMASNYNSRGLAPEILLEDGRPRLIRRRQTIDDLLELEEI